MVVVKVSVSEVMIKEILKFTKYLNRKLLQFLEIIYFDFKIKCDVCLS